MAGGIASNDAELAAILAPAVTEGLVIAGEMYVRPMIRTEIAGRVGRGTWGYPANGGGSLSEAWTVMGSAEGELGGMEIYYDSGKLTYDSGIGKHITPDKIWLERNTVPDDPEAIEDMASLIDLGLGGMLLGPDNPTRQATHFWESGVIPEFKGNAEGWIRNGLISAGLPVI